jgi:hypothetical protein
VRDPGGELTDAFHLLRLAKLRLQVHPLRVVINDQQHAALAVHVDGFRRDQRLAMLALFRAELALFISDNLAISDFFKNQFAIRFAAPKT